MLTSYKNLDPDRLYYGYPEGSMTFFFVPSTENLYIEPYPATHEDMLMNDDDLFSDVYGDLEWTSKERKDWSSRSQALKLTNALLGRIGAVGEDFVISFWNKNAHLQEFFNKLFQKFPVFAKNKDKIIVVTPEAASSLSGKELDYDTIAKADTAPSNSKKKFEIGGKAYSLQDLQNLRAAIHTKSKMYGDPLAVLCHPDLAKYPILTGYRPATCGKTGELRQDHPANWRRTARQQGQPYVYSYGETFKEFLTRNSIDIA